MMGLANTMTTTVTTMVTRNEELYDCLTTRATPFRSPRPVYCAAMTAPPMPIATTVKLMSWLIWSTMDTPDIEL